MRLLGILATCLVLFSCLASAPEQPITKEKPPKEIPLNGGGSDTETLTGLVSFADGLAAVGVQVKLLPATFDPSLNASASLRRTMTDSLGHFRFEKVDSTLSWNLIAGDPLRKTWSMAAAKRAGDSVPLTLSPAKVLLVTLHTSVYSTLDSGIAYFPGTDILARCDGKSIAMVDSLPEAVNRLIIVSRSGWRYDTTWVAQSDTTKVEADQTRLLINP